MSCFSDLQVFNNTEGGGGGSTSFYCFSDLQVFNNTEGGGGGVNLILPQEYGGQPHFTASRTYRYLIIQRGGGGGVNLILLLLGPTGI